MGKVQAWAACPSPLPATIAPKETSMTTTTYIVTGMTCGHCVTAVTSEVGELAGVSDVAIDLATGTVTVTSEAPLDPRAVRAAVDEAGYELVDQP
jgi:copper ion binding protein